MDILVIIIGIRWTQGTLLWGYELNRRGQLNEYMGTTTLLYGYLYRHRYHVDKYFVNIFFIMVTFSFDSI